MQCSRCKSPPGHCGELLRAASGGLVMEAGQAFLEGYQEYGENEGQARSELVQSE